MSLGDDNRLSILIQAKIDEASTQTMQKQLDTLSKNLKAVKIAIDLGDVEGQFLKLTKEIQKESAKAFVNKNSTVEVKGVNQTKKDIEKLRQESEKAFKELDKLGEVKGVKNMVVDATAGVKSFQAEVATIKNGMEYLQKVNVFGRFNQETKEWNYGFEKLGSTMKQVLSSFNYNEYTAEINKYFKEYQKGFMTVEDYYEKLQALMKSDDAMSKMSNLPDDVRNSMEKHYTEIETKARDHQKKMDALEKRNQSFGTFDESIKKIKEFETESDKVFAKMKELGSVKSFNEIFDTDGNITGYKVQVEEIKNNIKSLDNYNVIGRFNEETQQWEYALDKVSSKMKEVTKAKDSNDFGKSVRANLDDALKGAIDLEEGLERVSKQLRNKGGTGDFNGYFEKLPQGVQDEILADYQKLQKKVVDAKRKAQEKMDKLHLEAILEDRKRTEQAQTQAKKAREKELNEEAWKLKQEWKMAQDHHKKMKVLEEKVGSKQSTAEKKVNDAEYELRQFIDHDELEKAREGFRNIQVHTATTEKDIDRINKEIQEWTLCLDEVIARAKKIKKEQYELGALMAKDVEKEIAINEQKAQALKKIKELQASGLKVDHSSLDKLAESIEAVDYRSIDAKKQINKFIGEVKDLEKEAVKSAKQVNGLGDVLKKSFAMFSMYDAMQLGKEAIREMVEQVRILDDALVELQKVSDLSGSSLKDFTNDAFAVAEGVGRMGSDVIQSTADFKKMGFAVEESLKLAETAMVYSNVGDNVSPEEATKTLISTMKAFNIEAKDSISIIDKINAVSNNFAISSEGLGSALQRSASALMEANNSLDETLALYAVGNTITQDPESVSTGLRTISMRLRGVDEETGKLIPKFRQLFLQYTNGKVDIMDTNDQFKSTFDIIKDLGKEWQNLSDAQQANLAELTAGKQRANIFMSLMSSSKDLEKALGVSMGSMGSAMEENEKAMDSVTGKINQLKSALQQLSINTISSDFVKGVVDMLTVLVKLVDQIGLVNIALIAFGGYLAFSKGAVATKIVNSLGMAFIDLGTKIGSATVAQMGLNATMMAFAPVAIITAIVGIVKAFDLFTVTAEEQKQKVDELKGKYDELGSELDKLKAIAEPTEAEKKRIELLELERRATAKLVEENEKLLMQKEILGKGDWNPFTKGLAKDTEYTLTTDVEMTLNAIKNVEAELERLKSTGASEEIILRQEQHLQSLKDGLVSVVPELAQAEIKLTDALKYADEEEKEQIENTLQMLKTTLPLIEEVTGLAEEEERLAKSTGEVAESIRDVSLVMEDFREEEKKQQEETSKLADEYIELVDTIKQVEDGKALTLAQAKDIVEKYGLEYTAITQVADGYGVELDALYNLKNNKLTALQDMSKAENSHKNEAIKAIKARCKAIGVEIDSYGDLLKAKQTVIQNNRDAVVAKANENHPFAPYSDQFTAEQVLGEDIVNTLLDMNEELAKKNEHDLNVINESIKQWEEVKNNQKNSEEALSKLAGEYTGTLSSSQKKSAEKKGKSQSYISDNLDILIDDVLTKGDELATAIEFTSKKIDNAIAKGNKESELKLKEQLVAQMKDRVQATHEMANQLRAEGERLVKTLSATGLFKETDLKQLTEKQLADVVRTLEVKSQNATESQAQNLDMLKSKVEEYGNAIIRIYKDEIPALQQQWWDSENERIQQNIDLLNDRYEIQKRGTENALRDIELQQMLLDSDSEKYVELEKKKFDEILKAQQDTYEVIKKLKEMGYSEEDEQVEAYLDLWYDYERQKRQMMLDSAQKAQQLREEELRKEEDSLKEKQEAINELIENTIKLIKQEANERKKALEEELKGYKKVIDAKKESLEQEKDDRKDNKELEEKKSKVSEIEQKILELQFDTSAKATAERLRLEEELQKAREELEDFQFEQSIDKQQEALDKEYDQFEDNIKKQIDAIEDYLSKEGALRQEALNKIANSNRDLYNQLLEWNRQYGTGVDEDITNAWELATDAMAEFNNGQLDVVDTLDLIEQRMKAINQEIENMNNSNGFGDFGSSDNIFDRPEDMDKPSQNPDGGDYLSLRDEVAKQMIENSRKWEKATPEERASLHKDNERLAKKIGAWYSESDWSWYVMDNKVPKKLFDLYPQYHSGGIVGGNPKLKSTEEFAKLLKGEVVVTQEQMEKFMRVTMPSIMGVNSPAMGEIKIEKLFDLIVEGNLDSSVMPKLEELAKQIAPRIAETLNQSIFNKGFKKPI